jgi:hypothetical protein
MRAVVFMRAVVHPRHGDPRQDAGSLNTFGRNEIEVAPISSALLRIACLEYYTKLAVFRTKNAQPIRYQDRYEDSRSSINGPECSIMIRVQQQQLLNRPLRAKSQAAREHFL